MRSRSVVLDIFGDYVRYYGDSIRLSHLVTVLQAFDINEATARVTMARMRRDGWFDTSRHGRESVYAINAKSRALLDSGRRRIFERRTEPWDGEWHLVVYTVPETERLKREQLRKSLAWMGYGALAPSVWIAPHRQSEQIPAEILEDSTLSVDILTCRTKNIEEDCAMAKRCWDLDALAAAYTALLDTLRQTMDARRLDKLSPKEALVARVSLVSDYRRMPFSDPDLPAELLPTGWPGKPAHEYFLWAHDQLAPQAEQFYAECIGSKVRSTARVRETPHA